MGGTMPVSGVQGKRHLANLARAIGLFLGLKCWSCGYIFPLGKKLVKLVS
jgi:hypothetical protein